MHTVYENALLFSLEYSTWGLTVLLAETAKYNYEAPDSGGGGGGWACLGASLGPRSEAPGGASNYLAPALGYASWYATALGYTQVL